MNDKLMPFRAGSNRSNPSFFPITHRFDRTHARPPSATLVPPKDFDVDIEAVIPSGDGAFAVVVEESPYFALALVFL